MIQLPSTWWFGEAWGPGEGICTPEQWLPTPPVDCFRCEAAIEPDDRGIVTICSEDIASFQITVLLAIEGPGRDWRFQRGSRARAAPAVAYHVDCFFRFILGPDGEPPERKNPSGTPSGSNPS